MRIPHHLSRTSTGRWSFVQRVPVDLQAVLDRRLIKRTLRTKDLTLAHARAVVLGAAIDAPKGLFQAVPLPIAGRYHRLTEILLMVQCQ